ncbi:MAG: hypothetical protein KDB14_22855 [Planctomycetales bacterium]|nr:hypothetical protein [Planctomycetales bacterium]
MTDYPPRAKPQFRLRTLIGITLAVALLCGIGLWRELATVVGCFLAAPTLILLILIWQYLLVRRLLPPADNDPDR